MTAPGKGPSEPRPLDDEIRGPAERSLGLDLSAVRVRPLDRAAHGDVRAVAKDGDVYVDPAAARGVDHRELFGHELAHLAQQRRGGATSSTAMLEDEADRLAPDVARGTPVSVRGRATPSTPLFMRAKRGEGDDPTIGHYEIWVSDEGPARDGREWIPTGVDDETHAQIFAVVARPAKVDEAWRTDVKELIDLVERQATAAAIGGKDPNAGRVAKLIAIKRKKLAALQREPSPPVQQQQPTPAEDTSKPTSQPKPKKKKKKSRNEQSARATEQARTGPEEAEEPAEDEWQDTGPQDDGTGVWIGADHPPPSVEPAPDDTTTTPERIQDDPKHEDVARWREVGASRDPFHRKPRTRLRAPIIGLDGTPTTHGGRRFIDLVGTSFQSMTRGRFWLVFVKLPDDYDELDRDAQAKIFERVVSYAGRRFRLDQVDSDRPGLAAGVEEGCDLFGKFSPFVEASAYTRTALLNQAEYGGSGKLHGVALPDGTKLTLPARAEGEVPVPLEVRDGWGFIRESVARTMGVDVSPRPGSLERAANANPQMLMWFDEHRDASVEIVDHARTHLDRGIQGKSDDEVYRIATTGNFPLRVGTAMPSPTDEVILPSSLAPTSQPVAVHRNPADKPNWTTARSAPATDPTAQFLDSMWGLQYRWSGTEVTTGHRVICKGMVGIVPDARWPSQWADAKVLVARSDRKVDSSWKSQEDADIAKGKKSRPDGADKNGGEMSGDFLLNGDFNVNRVYPPRSFVAVPAPQMKELNGDYDGDTVHVLAHEDSPALFGRIQHDQRQMVNDKLPKNLHFDDLAKPAWQANNPFAPLDDVDDEHAEHAERQPRPIRPADRMVDAHGARALVGVWSTVADLLLTAHPDYRPELARMLGYQTEDDLWKVVLYGIKAGTDLPKTTLSDEQSGRDHHESVRWLLTEGRRLLKRLRKKLTNPHAKRRTPQIANDVRTGGRVLGNARRHQYGIIARVMRAVSERQSRSDEPLSGELRQPTSRTDTVGNRALREAHHAIEHPEERKPETPSELLIAIYDLIGAYSVRLADRRAAARWELVALRKLEPRAVYEAWRTRARLGVGGEIANEWRQQVAAVARCWEEFQRALKAPTPATPTERDDEGSVGALAADRAKAESMLRKEEDLAPTVVEQNRKPPEPLQDEDVDLLLAITRSLAPPPPREGMESMESQSLEERVEGAFGVPSALFEQWLEDLPELEEVEEVFHELEQEEDARTGERDGRDRPPDVHDTKWED